MCFNFQMDGDRASEVTIDVSEGLYGNMPLIQSCERPDRQILNIGDISGSALADQQVWVRGRLHTSRLKGMYWIVVARI